MQAAQPATTHARTGRDPPAPAHGRNATASAQHPGLQPGGFVGGAETAAFVAHQLHQRDPRVVGEEQMHVARQLVFEEGALLVDQQLGVARSEEHTSELQSLMRTSYAVFCLKNKNNTNALTNI